MTERWNMVLLLPNLSIPRGIVVFQCFRFTKMTFRMDLRTTSDTPISRAWQVHIMFMIMMTCATDACVNSGWENNTYGVGRFEKGTFKWLTMIRHANSGRFKGERVDVDVEPMFIFLFRDGTGTQRLSFQRLICLWFLFFDQVQSFRFIRKST